MSVVRRLRKPDLGQWGPFHGGVGGPRDKVPMREPFVTLSLVGKEKDIVPCPELQNFEGVMRNRENRAFVEQGCPASWCLWATLEE